MTPAADQLRTSEAVDALYFIRVRDGPVKIGRARNVAFRLRQLQCACPYDLEIVAAVPGDGDCEGVLHSLLSEHRIRGEWFRWSELVQHVANAAAADGRWRTALGMDERGENIIVGPPADNAPFTTTLSFPPFQSDRMRKPEGIAR